MPGKDLCALRHPDVHTGVIVLFPADGMYPVAVVAGHIREPVGAKDIFYFRRVLCALVGGWVENGEYPADMKSLESIVKGISYNNAVQYFGFDLDVVK